MAFDWYPNGEDGPHFGFPFTCPAAGVVTRYSFGPGPLGIQCTEGETDVSSGLQLLGHAQIAAIEALGTMMHIAVLAFDQPQRTPGGYTARAIWIGHTQDEFTTGRRQQGDGYCLCGRSGVEFPGCDASHGHVCGTATGQLSPNGDIPGVEVVRLLGGRPRVTTVPGPTQYMSGGWDRGKRR